MRVQGFSEAEVVSVGLHNDDISVFFNWRRSSIREYYRSIFIDDPLKAIFIHDDYYGSTGDAIRIDKYAPATPINNFPLITNSSPDDDSFIQVEITFP